MRRFALSLLLLLLLAPLAARAATCTVNSGETAWTSPTQDIASDCTEAATSDYIVPTGATLVVNNASAVALTTGTITISGGTLRVPCGYTLTYGARLHLRSGLLDVQGCVRTEQRITAVSWGAASATVTLATDASANVTAGTDWLVYEDDDPDDPASTISGQVQIGAGNPNPGIFRPSFNKWAWYDVNAVSGSDVTYYYDSLTGRGGSYTGVPYAGSRAPGLYASTAITSAARHIYGFNTELTTSAAGTWIRADLASQYVEYTSGVCSGLMAKVLNVVDAGATETITVAGDTLYCGQTPTIKIHYGARAGDLVRIVRPAVLYGADTGAVILSGGEVRLTNAIIKRPGFQGKTTAPFDGTTYDTLARNCDLCIINDSASGGPTGTIARTLITNPTTTAGDTSVIGLLSSRNGATVARYGIPLSLAGIVFDRLNIKDGINNNSGAGTHGFFLDGAIQGLTASRLRIERLSDDLYGEDLSTTVATPANKSSVTVRQALLWEGIAGTDNSQECFEPGVVAYGTGTNAEVWLNAGYGTYSDIVAMGCYGGPVSTDLLGGTLARIVAGSAYSAANNRLGMLSAFTSNLPGNALGTYPATISDSIVGMLSPSTSSARAVLKGNVTGSIVFGDSATASPPSADTGPSLSSSFISLPSTGTAAFLWSNSAAGETWAGPTMLTDDVFSGSGAVYLAHGYAEAGMTTWNLSRVFIALSTPAGANHGIGNDTWDNNTSPTCPGGGCPVSLSVNRVTISPTTPSTYSLGAGSNGIDAGATAIANVCAGASPPTGSSNAGHFSTFASSTTILTRDTRPRPGEPGTLREFLAPPGATGCEADRPTTLGLQTLGVAHAALGDFVLSQLENWSSKDLAKPRGGAGGGWTPRAY